MPTATVALSSDVPVTPPAVPGDEGLAAEPRDEAWASQMEAALRRELTEFAEPHTEAKCGPGGRCRVRIRTSAMVGQIAAAARLPGCTLEEATPEGETAVYLVNCLEEGPGWPARTEQELDKRLSAKARERGVRLHAVECRSQRCRVVLGFERLEAARALNIDEFWSALQATRQFEGGALSGFEPGPDDRGVIQSIVMNRTKGGWETHKSQYEYRVDRDARLARLRAEPRDEDWATKTEAILRSEYEKELGKDAVVSVECRTKRCELTYRAAAERSASSAPTPKERVAALRRRSALFRFRDLADGCHMHAQSADATASGEELLVHWFTCRR